MKNKDRSLIALVCGALGLFGGVIPVIGKWYITLPLAIVAIVIGSKCRKSGKQSGESTGFATAGLVMGILGVVLAVLKVLLLVISITLGVSLLGGLLEGLAGLLQ